MTEVKTRRVHEEHKLQEQRQRIVVPNSVKNLATTAAWVLFILGCICFACGIAHLVLISFDILPVASFVTIQLMFIGFSILCWILASVAAWGRRQIE
jgi:hypothetical protein